MNELKRPWCTPEENAYFDFCDEWKKTQKEFLPADEVKKLPDGKIAIIGRVGDRSIKVGDSMGYAKVLRIEAYGKSLQESGEGLGCCIVFDRMPYFNVLETIPSYEEWEKRHDRAGISGDCVAPCGDVVQAGI